MNADPRSGSQATEPGTALAPVLDQRFDVDGLYQVRAAVAAHAAELGLSSELANDVVIAVHELASNSVRHGPGCGRLRIWAVPQALTCEVADGAAAADTPAGPAPTDVADSQWPVEPGHGLWLAGKVADRLTIHHDDHGSAVTVRFDLR